MKSIKRYRVLSFFLPVFFICACSVDYEATEIDQSLEEKIPETVLEDLVQTKVEKGRIVYRVKAEKAETYSKQKKSMIYGIYFEQYNKEKHVSSTGRAKLVSMNTDNNNADLDGSVWFRSDKEKIQVESEFLSWDNGNKEVKGKPEISVKITKDSGTSIEGKGFVAKTTEKTVEFNAGSTGVFVPDDKESKEESDEKKK